MDCEDTNDKLRWFVLILDSCDGLESDGADSDQACECELDPLDCICDPAAKCFIFAFGWVVWVEVEFDGVAWWFLLMFLVLFMKQHKFVRGSL